MHPFREPGKDAAVILKEERQVNPLRRDLHTNHTLRDAVRTSTPPHYLLFLRQDLLNAEPGNPFYEVGRDRFVQREMYGTFACVIGKQFLPELPDTGCSRKKTNVVAESREMDEVCVIQPEGGDPVPDRFLSVRCCPADHGSYTLEFLLHIQRERCNVIID